MKDVAVTGGWNPQFSTQGSKSHRGARIGDQSIKYSIYNVQMFHYPSQDRPYPLSCSIFASVRIVVDYLWHLGAKTPNEQNIYWPLLYPLGDAPVAPSRCGLEFPEQH